MHKCDQGFVASTNKAMPKRATANMLKDLLPRSFLLNCIQQQTLSPAQIAKLKEKLHAVAIREKTQSKPEQLIETLRAALAKVAADKETAARNMALAENSQQFQAMAAVFDEHVRRESKLQTEFKEAEAKSSESTDVNTEVNNALGLLQRLTELATSAESLAAAGELFRLANARMFLRFKPVKLKKQVAQQVAGGVVTFGSTNPLIEIYSGCTTENQ